MPPRFSTRLNDKQREALRACANGISLRFEKTEIVQALLAVAMSQRMSPA